MVIAQVPSDAVTTNSNTSLFQAMRPSILFCLWEKQFQIRLSCMSTALSSGLIPSIVLLMLRPVGGSDTSGLTPEP